MRIVTNHPTWRTAAYAVSVGVALVAGVAVLIGCGLPTLIYLAPPNNIAIQDVSPTEPVIAFFHDRTNNNDNFRGYTLYYKFYDKTTNPTGCRSDRNFITGTPVVLGVQRLLSREYRTVVLNDDRNRSIIDIPDRTIENRMSIVLRSAASGLTSTVTRVASGDTMSYDLYRNVENPGSESVYKPLALSPPDQFTFTSGTTADADISRLSNNLAAILRDESLYVAFYAIASGINNSFALIYSEPVFLGYLSMYTRPAASEECNNGLL